jgi:uncharacterized protein YndB with AHSA1/START domain
MTMTTDRDGKVTVTRRMDAPAPEVFARLADPAQHPNFDGSGMVRDGTGNGTVSAVGDVFTMKMHNDEMGHYEMRNHVVEYELNRRLVWEPEMSAASRAEDRADIGIRAGHRWGYELVADGSDVTVVTEIFECTEAPEQLRAAIGDGERWLESMTISLERLDQLCTPS